MNKTTGILATDQHGLNTDEENRRDAETQRWDARRVTIPEGWRLMCPGESVLVGDMVRDHAEACWRDPFKEDFEGEPKIFIRWTGGERVIGVIQSKRVD